ncbi:unnamed protein product [Auanema sp. JU1783]|nr:unnamed protein product [Auanema sp. JU1783]
MLTAGVLSHTLVVVVTVLLTSGIWLTAYFAGVKPSKSVNTYNYNYNGCNSSTTSSCPDLPTPPSCADTCEFVVCESIPDGLQFDPKYQRFNSTTDCWMRLLKEAQQEVLLGSFYWSLLVKDTGDNYTSDPTNTSGQQIYDNIVSTAKRGVNFRITQTYEKEGTPETEEFQKLVPGKFNVRSLDFTQWYKGGILHTKSWAVDGKHLYVGSANFDWRSLRQVKELGIAVFNCPCLAQDLTKLLDIYWEMGAPGAKIPQMWPQKYSTGINHQSPITVPQSQGNQAVYFSASPPGFQSCGREDDLTAMIKAIDEARSSISLAVMDYSCSSLYLSPNYWSAKLDEAIRRAAFDRQVKVRFMMSRWPDTRKEFYTYLRSLNDVSDQLPCVYSNGKCSKRGSIEVRLIEVPVQQFGDIPFARVYHNKYFVTESTGYVGTSNWSPDYWSNTAGIGMIIRSDDSTSSSYLVANLQNIFDRDWNSNYTTSINKFDNNGNRIN